MMFQASAIEYDPAGQNTILDYEVKVKANVFLRDESTSRLIQRDQCINRLITWRSGYEET